ncbi:HAD-IA family hydrolase [Corynebacterium sp.]|uniref:HAD-IA family hydrolase n=1 Tax=Corynebacterium sp. TaxID=1720 RepID=UPI0026DC9666|nr:HAD-IA family hydrolase [Corynebacterium sp.]MDO5032711.1 HAD-IA family hydrolase [Corynebacterium sp.]
MSIALAIFDMAGTTVNERDEVYRVLREAAEREGAQFSDETFQKYMGTEKRWAIGKLLSEGGIEPTPEIHEKAWQWFREELDSTYRQNPPQPIDGVEEAFAALRAAGIKVGLTTGFSREIVDLILGAMGWDDSVIDFSAAGDEVEAGRPEPFLIQRVMEQAGVTDPAQVLSCGDTEADVVSAQRAQVTSVGVLTGHLSREKFGELGADHVLDSAAEITGLPELAECLQD